MLATVCEVESAEPAVGAYGINETREIVAEIIQKEAANSVTVNFTGGTKCMSIGAYQAAQEAGAGAVYVDTANETLVWFRDAEPEPESFRLEGRLTVPLYLQANGRVVDEKRTEKHHLIPAAYEAARQLVLSWPHCVSSLEIFGKAISQGQSVVDNVAVIDEVARILIEHHFVQRQPEGWRIMPIGKAFLGGKWLEAMVHIMLEGSKLFDDVASELRLAGVESELDVLVTRNGVLAIIECKSGDLGGQTTLNKLQAIRTGFGTFARTFFVTSRESSQVNDAFRNRAREHGVRAIITAEGFPQLATEMKKLMKGTP